MTMHTFARASGWMASILLVLTPLPAGAQTLERRIASAPAGSVGFVFTTRPNVCGDGISITLSDDTSDGWTTRSTRRGTHIGRSMSNYSEPCQTGLARVVLKRTASAVSSVTVTVGGRPERADTEIADVSSAEAAHYLLLVAPQLRLRSAENAVMGAAIADSALIWRRLLEIARDAKASESSRKASIFWLSHEATAAALAGLDTIATDDDGDTAVRADALFHLANRPGGEGVPVLIRVVETSSNRKLRRDALWHLSQSGDPRALSLFEQLLTRN